MQFMCNTLVIHDTLRLVITYAREVMFSSALVCVCLFVSRIRQTIQLIFTKFNGKMAMHHVKTIRFWQSSTSYYIRIMIRWSTVIFDIGGYTVCYWHFLTVTILRHQQPWQRYVL